MLPFVKIIVMDKHYKGIIWTNHAIDRMHQRGVSQKDAYATWSNPDNSRYAESKGAWVYYKDLGNRQIEVVAKQNDRKEWLIISVWAKDREASKQYHKAHKPKQSLLLTFIKKIFG
jgi:hypothetical protein